jgi:hypothetical protein
MNHRYEVVLDENQFALIVTNRYGDDAPAVTVRNASQRAEKRRAEELRLVATVMEWAKERGITYDGETVVG